MLNVQYSNSFYLNLTPQFAKFKYIEQLKVTQNTIFGQIVSHLNNMS